MINNWVLALFPHHFVSRPLCTQYKVVVPLCGLHLYCSALLACYQFTKETKGLSTMLMRKTTRKTCWPLSLLTPVIVNRRWRQLLHSFEYKTAELSIIIASCSHKITVILMMDANRLGALWDERLWYVLMSVKTLCLFLDLIRQALLAFLFLMEHRL